MDSAWSSPSTYDDWPYSTFSKCHLAGLLLLICASGKGFGVVLGLIFMVLINYLFLLIFGNETKCCFEPFFLVVFWNGFLLSKVKKEDVPCRFCGAPDNDGHLFWDCTFPPFIELRNKPEFLPLMSRDRTHWTRCLLWHGWLPGLSSRTVGTPWAIASSDLASSCLETALGPCPLSASSAWHPFWDQDDVQDTIDDVLLLLRSGLTVVGNLSLILMLRLLELVLLFILLLSFLIVIIGVMLRILAIHMRVALTSSRVSQAPFSLFRELSTGVSFLLCKLILVFHSGIDNMNVLRGVAALLSHKVPRSPLLLMKDGDLLATIHSVLNLRGFDMVKVSKVKGHATRAMVASGDVRLEDPVGNNNADAAADFGRSRQQDDVITARRDLLRVRRLWYPIMLDLHRFMVAISRIEVNHDGFGGTAPDAMVWDKGGIVKTRAPSFRLIIATLPGPPDFLSSTWCTLDSLPITHDVAAWPHSVDILGHMVLPMWVSLAFPILNCF